VDFVVLPPGHGSSVTDFWGWDAQEAQLRCSDDVSGDIGGWSTRRALKLKFYQPTQTMVTAGILTFRENSHGRAGNRTRDLVISSQRHWPLDHEDDRTVAMQWEVCLCAGNLSALLVWDCVLPEGSALYSQCSKYAIQTPIVTNDRTQFIYCVTTLSAVQIIQGGMTGWLFGDELEGIWKEVLVALFEVLNLVVTDFMFCLHVK